MSTELPTPARVLAVGAHPDDIEFGCGATLATWARAGTHVELAVLTDGSKGTWDPAAEIAELVATRQHEQRAAAETLGAHAVHFFGAVDGELEADARPRVVACASWCARSAPMSSSGTTRGSSIACTPITGAPASS